MNAEMWVYGVLFPPLLLSAAVAALLTALLRRVMISGGLYRWVWHPALFDLALFMLLLGGVDAVISG